MRRRTILVFGGAVVIVVLALAELEIPIRLVEVGDGRWGTDVGCQYVFAITVTGQTTSFGQVFPPDNSILNNTRIIVTITTLPEFQSFYDNTTFLTDIILKTKVSCAFENGSSLLADHKSLLDGLISCSILPVSMWEQIDYLYSDDYDEYYSGFGTHWTWRAKPENETFFLAHTGKEYHGAEGWRSWINTTTGVPCIVQDYESFLWGSGPAWYLLVLTLDSS